MKKQKRRFSKSMTAEELITALQQDPEWVRRQQDRELLQAKRRAALDADERPIVADIYAAGLEVQSIWDLVNTGESYLEAVPVLVRHLRLPYLPATREGIARALTVKEARGIPAREILSLLKETGPDPVEGGFRWCLANALTVAGDQSMVPEIDDLLADETYKDCHPVLEVARKKCLKVRLKSSLK